MSDIRPLTLQMAEGVQAISASKLPRAAIGWATTVMVDTIGVALAGLTEDCTRLLLDTEDIASGGGDSLVFGTSLRLSSLDAALVNGTSAHALDYDDMAAAAATHPSTVIVPALFALAERHNRSGKDFVAAYVAGFETSVRLAQSIYFHHYEKGWHPTATLGTFGAAAACAHLLRLDVEQTSRALALAASMSSGIKANFGTMTKPFHAGQAARDGLLAAMLAAKGWTANPSALEHPQGFFNTFNGPGTYWPEKLMQGWAEPLAIVSTPAGIKLYPCCGSTHGSILMSLKLRERHQIDVENIESVELLVHPRRIAHTDNPDPQTPLAGKFSQQYVVSRALVDGAVELDHFTKESLDQPVVRALMKKVKLGRHPEFNDDMKSHFGAKVVIRMADGAEYAEETREDPWPTNAEPVSEDLLFRKFKDCARQALPEDRIPSLFESLTNLWDQPNFGQLSRLLEYSNLESESSVRPRVVSGGEWIP